MLATLYSLQHNIIHRLSEGIPQGEEIHCQGMVWLSQVMTYCGSARRIDPLRRKLFLTFGNSWTTLQGYMLRHLPQWPVYLERLFCRRRPSLPNANLRTAVLNQGLGNLQRDRRWIVVGTEAGERVSVQAAVRNAIWGVRSTSTVTGILKFFTSDCIKSKFSQ